MFHGCFLTPRIPRPSGLNRRKWTLPLAVLALVPAVLVPGVCLFALPLLGVVTGNWVPLLDLTKVFVLTTLPLRPPLRAPGRVFGNRGHVLHRAGGGGGGGCRVDH